MHFSNPNRKNYLTKFFLIFSLITFNLLKILNYHKMKIKLFLIILSLALPVTLLSGQKNSKKINISGFVTDVNKRPVAGATILVDNINTHKFTHKNGFYKVKVHTESKIISVLPFSGGVTESVINGQTEINFSLPIDVLSERNIQKDPNGEESVNTNYGSVKKKNLIAPVDKVDGLNKKYASYQNIYEILRQQPGVQVNGNKVMIRGASSLLGGTEPLFIVNDIPTTDINDIMPQMVKSIEVLKGSETSIYGSRGGNGVIIIKLIGPSDGK